MDLNPKTKVITNKIMIMKKPRQRWSQMISWWGKGLRLTKAIANNITTKKKTRTMTIMTTSRPKRGPKPGHSQTSLWWGRGLRPMQSQTTSPGGKGPGSMWSWIAPWRGSLRQGPRWSSTTSQTWKGPKPRWSQTSSWPRRKPQPRPSWTSSQPRRPKHVAIMNIIAMKKRTKIRVITNNITRRKGTKAMVIMTKKRKRIIVFLLWFFKNTNIQF